MLRRIIITLRIVIPLVEAITFFLLTLHRASSFCSLTDYEDDDDDDDDDGGMGKASGMQRIGGGLDGRDGWGLS